MKNSAATLLTIILLLEETSCEAKIFSAPNEIVLTDYLCKNKLRNETDPVVELEGNGNYSIGSQGFCHIQHRGSTLTIMGTNGVATITCGNKGLDKPTTGFVFNAVTLNMYQVNFHQCGADLISLSNKSILFNESRLYYSTYRAVVLLLIESQLNITSMNISSCYGFGILAINPYRSELNNVNITNGNLEYSKVNDSNWMGHGSGMIIHFLDTKNTGNNNHIISINKCCFKDNINYYGQHCIAHYYHNISKDKGPIVNAAALSIVYEQTSFKANVIINSSIFTKNIGSLAGAILVLQLHTVNATTKLYNSIFDFNVNLAKCFGSSFVYYFLMNKTNNHNLLHPLLIDNTIFKNHFGVHRLITFHGNAGKGAVYLGFFKTLFYRVKIKLKSVTFYNNTAETTASCLLATVYDHFDYTKITISLENVTAHNNYQNAATASATGLFVFHRVKTINLRSTNTFINNYGSVIEAHESQIYLSGKINFTGNTGKNGAAILLQDSKLYITDGLQAVFMKNRAEHMGGAIFGSSTTILDQSCIIQTNTRNLENASFFANTSVTFSGNSALTAGNDIYIQHLYNCYNEDSTVPIPLKIFKHICMPNTTSNNNLRFSTSPKSLVIHNLYKVQSGIHYPGETIILKMSAVDGKNNHVYTNVATTIVYTTHFHHHNIVIRSRLIGIKADQAYQTITESKQRKTTDIMLTITVEKECIHRHKKCKGIALVSPLDSVLSKSVVFGVYNCPLGFQLKKGICACDDLINYFYEYENFKQAPSCNITLKTIAIPQNIMSPWLGIVKESTLGISAHCPLSYCTNVENYNYYLKSNNGSSIFMLRNNNHTKNICVDGRNDTLCGKCNYGLSTVFGSTICKECSSWWLCTTAVYAALGPLVIYLLYALRLTLASGTLNGILFYVQIMNGFQLCNNDGNINFETRFCSIFTSLLTLNLGFPVCFYNGMSELAKAMLNLAFPVYLLTIVVILIIVSRYTRVANRISHSSVQVLVTVIHLSFSKLLQATIDVLVPVIIFTKERHGQHHKKLVWSYDGEIEYGDPRHAVLATLTGLLAVAIIVPYLLILAGGRLIIKRGYCSGNLRPFYEAIHGPFKESKRIWFTLRLLLVIIVTVSFALLQGTYSRVMILVFPPISLVFSVAHAYARPYKNKWLNLLDCGIMINYVAVISTATILYLERSKIETIQTVVFTSVLATFLAFLAVIVYHVLWVKGYLLNLGKIFKRNITSTPLRTSPTHVLLGDASDSYYNSCSQYREPVVQY